MDRNHVTCEQCREIYFDMETPCDKCWPGIHKYNSDAVSIYEHCNTQLIYSSAGAVGLDLRAVNIVFDMLEIEDNEYRLDLWSKMQKITDALIGALRKEAEEKRGNNGKTGY